MAQLEVMVERLNRRRSPVTNFADKSNVVDVVPSGFRFESVGYIENILGGWHQHQDGLWSWEKGLNMLQQPLSFLAPAINNQWWYKKLRIDDIQKIVETFTQKSNVTVAVLDTGLVDKIDFNNAFNLSGSHNFINNTSSIIDIKSGHGTLCASIISASSKMFGSINPFAKIFVAKIFTDIVATNERIISNAITTLCDPKNNYNIDIISISGGIDDIDSSSPLNDAIKFAQDNSVIVCAAIGNRVQTAHGYYPALSPFAFSIGALDENFQYSERLNPATGKIDYLLPGENIHSLNYLASENEFDGTSHACAIMSGILSLIICIVKNKNLRWRIEDFRLLVNSSCDQITIASGQSFNRINPDLLIQKLKML